MEEDHSQGVPIQSLIDAGVVGLAQGEDGGATHQIVVQGPDGTQQVIMIQGEGGLDEIQNYLAALNKEGQDGTQIVDGQGIQMVSSGGEFAQFNVMEGDETDEESSHPMHEGQEISVASIASLLGDSGRGATITYTEEGGTIITTADGTVVQTQQSLEELQKQLQASEGGQNIVLVPPEQLPPGVDTSNLQVVHTPSGPQLLQTSPEDGDTRHMHDSSMMPVSSAEESDMEEGYMPGESQQVQIIQDPSGGGQTIQIVDDPDGDGQQIVLQEEDDDEYDENETKFAIAQAAAAAAAGGGGEQSVILNAGNTYQTVTIVPSEVNENGEVSYVLIVSQPDDGTKQEEDDDMDMSIYDFKDENLHADDDGVVRRMKTIPSKKVHHPQMQTQQLMCNYCNYTSPKRYLLTRHMKTHSEERPHKCEVCERGFKTLASLQNHVNTHTGTKPHRCKECESCFTTSGELVRHVRYRHTFEKPHKCPECDYCSVELSKLKRHIRSHTGERPYACPHCSYASPDTFKLKRHLRIHTGEKPYECDVCHQRFTQSNSLKAHRLIHSGNKPIFKCELCPTTCGRKTDLKIHVQKLHTSDRPLRCKRCGKSFPDRYTYKLHMKTHDGEKCFKCDHCPYACLTERHLKMHLLTHTGEKPFECDECDQSFRQKQLLKRHKNLYHTPDYLPRPPREKTHECGECDKAFAHKGNLIRHLATHDPELQGMVKDEEDYDDDYSSEDETDDEGMGRRRQQVVHLSQMGSDGAVPQGQPILLQMEFLQQEGEEGGEGENGQVVRKVTRQATLQTTPDGQQIIILQGEDDVPQTSPSKKYSEGTGRSRGRPAKPAVEMPLGDGLELLDEAQEAELAASIEGVSALNGQLVGSANTGRRARMKAAAEDDAAELQASMGDQMITVNGESGMITLSGLGDSDSDEDVMGGTELKIGPDGTIMNMGDLSGMRHQVVAAEDGTVTLVVTEDLDEDDEDDAGQHQYSINEDGTIEIRVKDESGNIGAVDSQVSPSLASPIIAATTTNSILLNPPGMVSTFTSNASAVAEAATISFAAPEAESAVISRLVSQPPPKTTSKDIEDCFGFDEDDDAAPNVALMTGDDEDEEGAEDAAGVL